VFIRQVFDLVAVSQIKTWIEKPSFHALRGGIVDTLLVSSSLVHPSVE
jgi:hypothetical protein